MIVCMWKIFEKAGYHGWKAIIPIYNLMILTKISMGNMALALLILIPVVNVIWMYIMYCKLAISFGWSTGKSIVLMVLFPLIGFLMLGFGNDYYVGSYVGEDY